VQPVAQGACRCEAGRGNSSKSDGVLCKGVAMKYAWVEKSRDEYTVSRLCRVLSVSRSRYCQWRVRSPSARALANQALDAQVAAIYRDSCRSYGRPRIVQQLRPARPVRERRAGAPKPAASRAAPGLTQSIWSHHRLGPSSAGGA